MYIKNLGNNCNLITHNNKYYVVSYASIVAVIDCTNHKLYTINEYWRCSTTTSKHINKIFEFLGFNNPVKFKNNKTNKLEIENKNGDIYKVVSISKDDFAKYEL